MRAGARSEANTMNAEVAPSEGSLSRAEIMAALDALCARMDGIEARCPDGFPLYSPGTADDWTTSSGGSWVGGFWAGCWWLRARLGGSASGARKALRICQRLAPKMHADSVHRAMLFWYGAALGAQWCGNGEAHGLAREAAGALAASYDPVLRCIPTGTAIGGGSNGSRRIVVDALAPVVGLLTLDHNAELETVARRHTDTLIAACFIEQGACHAEAVHAHGVWRPIDRAGVWSRGQAWAMLGLAAASARWGQPYTAHLRMACEDWRRSRPRATPPDRLDEPSGLVDPSATLIAALAMRSLAARDPEEAGWKAVSESLIAAVVRSRYLTGSRDAGVPAGMFWGACYRTGPDRRELVESAWSTFLLMQALCSLAGVIDTDPCGGPNPSFRMSSTTGENPQ
ncbi:glucuronyl hydrolase (plasmid) [Ralstonia solanacearum]|uniref:Glucuronyl hydrolase n=3 Tax=Ralstonia solanacearum TaxID=305 RepID=A0AAD0WIA1_RALSL|nr:glucuronyl hydrolase [Ralstonia solanacearum]AXW55101.1 glucuronyl hydrolase [Ralstonia solanacearum]CBJ35247.1 Unsaturated glucuronyl hydrolase [Ralstonia solanacearum PSI07]